MIIIDCDQCELGMIGMLRNQLIDKLHPSTFKKSVHNLEFNRRLDKLFFIQNCRPVNFSNKEKFKANITMRSYHTEPKPETEMSRMRAYRNKGCLVVSSTI